MKGNLLIIDNEKNLTDNLQILFSKYTDKVFTANNGTDGLRILNNETIHCVVCDIYMPELSGIEVVKKTREQGNKVPFIFFTAYGEDELRGKVSHYEHTLFLLKPDISSIVKIIESMLKLGMTTSS
jgi:YesN/AraC family two-component response regulator